MRVYTVDEIRQCFSTSTDFNEIFDAFQSALSQKIKDVEPYRLLFWNHSLTPDEVRLFGEKLAGEFPDLAYDVYLWLASVFEVTYSSSDNYELALHYYQKAASVKPTEPDPYLDACDCYDSDLNIPPLVNLIEFMKQGVNHVHNPRSLYKRLAHLYELAGNTELSDLYRHKGEEPGEPPAPPETPAPE
jgi:tetratricopeptide (TPR) repeat protein